MGSPGPPGLPGPPGKPVSLNPHFMPSFGAIQMLWFHSPRCQDLLVLLSVSVSDSINKELHLSLAKYYEERVQIARTRCS